MALVSPYQYVWSSIQGPLARDLGISLPTLGLVFTLFVFFQSGSQFPAGWLAGEIITRAGYRLTFLLAGGVALLGIVLAWHAPEPT